MASGRKRVLFLCTGNSCRSQMAEGLLRQLAGDRYESLSAGADPSGYVHPLAVRVMQELEIDISDQRSKHIDEFLPPAGSPPDLIISVCAAADKQCPVFPAAVEQKHTPFDDPAHAEGTDEQKLVEFRRVRDEIRAMIERDFLPADHEGNAPQG
ncbi:MAG: arsenate reductase ArsC [Planctomycetota bacterium]|nr:MAG: arsenate reductase ArsC [Planctomycetota bacterium]REJ89479.1 MAG: arsenate reductase ArsC [Planctomycetota bacterium]REK28950.1 MAG: arsenate reductase ArsC [Planctomycetota bacterium]REK39616.1 MAG: arsenate reductase ArsC [Planctomycetota bacterium]